MFLFPCNRPNIDEPKLGFSITTPNPKQSSTVRLYYNDDLFDEMFLTQVNNFIEIPINDKDFKIKFKFFSKDEVNNKFYVSNITWAPEKQIRRIPICFLHNNEQGELLNLQNVFSATPNDHISINFENFITPADRRIRIHNIKVNGAIQPIALSPVWFVQDFKPGIGVATLHQKQNIIVPYSYGRLRLRIVDTIEKIHHRSHFIKIKKINNIEDYFEFVRIGYNISIMAYITVFKKEKYLTDKYFLPKEYYEN